MRSTRVVTCNCPGISGLKAFAGVNMQQTNDEEFCRQIFRVLKIDANVPVDTRMFMQTVPCGNTLLTAGSRRW